MATNKFINLLYLWTVLIVFVLGSSSCSSDSDHTAEIIIKNESGKLISEVTIDYLGKKYVKKNIASGASATVSFGISREESYKITGVFVDGMPLDDISGYLTKGVNISDRISVFENDIKLERSIPNPK